LLVFDILPLIRPFGPQDVLTFDATMGRRERFQDGLKFISRLSSCSTQALQG